MTSQATMHRLARRRADARLADLRQHALRRSPPMLRGFRLYAFVGGVRQLLIAWTLLAGAETYEAASFDDILGLFGIVTWGYICLASGVVIVVAVVLRLEWFVRLGMTATIAMLFVWTTGLMFAWRDGLTGPLGVILLGALTVKDLLVLWGPDRTFVVRPPDLTVDA